MPRLAYMVIIVVMVTHPGCACSSGGTDEQNTPEWRALAERVDGLKLEDPELEFVARLEQAVNDHDWDTVLNDLVDSDYVREQHDEFLSGRTDQFLSELLLPSLGTVKASAEECLSFYRNSEHGQLLARIEDFTVTAVLDHEIHYTVSLSSLPCTYELKRWLRQRTGLGQQGFFIIGARY